MGTDFVVFDSDGKTIAIQPSTVQFVNDVGTEAEPSCRIGVVLNGKWVDLTVTETLDHVLTALTSHMAGEAAATAASDEALTSEMVRVAREVARDEIAKAGLEDEEEKPHNGWWRSFSGFGTTHFFDDGHTICKPDYFVRGIWHKYHGIPDRTSRCPACYEQLKPEHLRNGTVGDEALEKTDQYAEVPTDGWWREVGGARVAHHFEDGDAICKPDATTVDTWEHFRWEPLADTPDKADSCVECHEALDKPIYGWWGVDGHIAHYFEDGNALCNPDEFVTSTWAQQKWKILGYSPERNDACHECWETLVKDAESVRPDLPTNGWWRKDIGFGFGAAHFLRGKRTLCKPDEEPKGFWQVVDGVPDNAVCLACRRALVMKGIEAVASETARRIDIEDGEAQE
jgi:hypothetical protein